MAKVVKRAHRTKSGTQKRGSGSAYHHAQSHEHLLLGRAIRRAAKSIPIEKEQALGRAIANGLTGPGRDRTLASIWKEWR